MKKSTATFAIGLLAVLFLATAGCQSTETGLSPASPAAPNAAKAQPPKAGAMQDADMAPAPAGVKTDLSTSNDLKRPK